MTDEHNRVKAIFVAALEKESLAERVAYLDQACADNAALRQRVDSLLRAHDQADRLLDQPAIEHLDAPAAEGMNPQLRAALNILSPSSKPGSLGRLGHYDVQEVVGKGGMGIVLRAFDEKLHRIVAIKMLSPALAGDDTARQRFVREARAAAAVTHENVIDIHSVEDGHTVPYLVMQYVSGCTLQQKLDRAGQLPVKEVLRVGLQVADGLAAAHRQGLIHRDIKPANILLENGVERVKITDFGLARTADDAHLTQSGYISGTPAYMSPEQANAARVDHRSDLFSLGSVLYAMCAGHPPFGEGSSLAILSRICHETPRPVREVNPGVPHWLEAIIDRLHAKDPVNRFATAAEVAAVMSRCLTQLQAGADPTPLTMPARNRQPQISRFFRPAILVALAAVVAVAGWYFGIYRPANRQGPAGGNASEPPASVPAGPFVLKPTHTLFQHTRGVRTLAFSRDGTMVASGGLDRHIFLWNTKNWEVRGPLEGHSGDVSSVDFAPDGARLASVTSSADDCLIRIWDTATGKPAKNIGMGGANTGMWDVAYSPDGRTLACGGWDKHLRILDVLTGNEQVVVSDVATRLVRDLSFSPDGRQIATGGGGATHLWDAESGKEVSTRLKLPEEMCPTILPGNQRLVGWTYGEGRVTLCELPSGRIINAWLAHPQKNIEGLAASVDGRFIASFGSDGVAKIWSVADQVEIATLIGHKGRILAGAFSPDGARLATGGDDLSIRIWDLPDICRTAK